MINDVALWSECLGRSISDVNVDIDEAKKYGTVEFFVAAKAIVEPENIDDNYYEFLENDMKNWVGFIRTCCGDDYHEVAKLVRENGY